MDNSQPITLRQLATLVAKQLQNPLLQNRWVTADLSDVGVKGGHCYLELIEKDDAGATVARIRGMIWANNYSRISANFQAVTGGKIQSGIKVMLCVSVNYHAQYGMSVVINDINPEFTLGDMERRRREILARLKAEGVDNMNKSLAISTPVPQRIAVISSDSAAGYGDFMNQLNNNPRGYKFYTCLFRATMQGRDTSPTIIAALMRIAEHIDLFDCVVIIRGGGATGDLNSFDDYDLANNVAQFTLPIITGIGHERDNTVLDYISWLRVKTPTAAAEWLIAQADKMMNSVEQLSKSVVLNAREYLSSQKEQMAYLSTTIPHTAQSLLDNARATLQRYAISIPANARTRVSTSLASLDHIADTIRSATAQRVAMARLEIERLDSCVEILNPRNTLNRGYALIRKNGKFITSSDQLEPGDEIVTNLKSGTVRSIVKQIKH